MLKCSVCSTPFKTSRALKCHLLGRPDCMGQYVENDIGNTSSNNNCEDNKDGSDNVQIESVTDSPFIIETTNKLQSRVISDELENTNLSEQQIQHALSGYYQTLAKDDIHKSQTELLFILKKAKTPLYVYDEILKWIQKITNQHNINVIQNDLVNRSACLTRLYNQYDLKGLQPIQSSIYLLGSKKHITITKHDFQQCLYSLLNDMNLMKEENLLLNKDNLFFNGENNRRHTLNINDIDSGNVYQNAKKIYLNINSNDVLLPIIFFIDKTHTDNHGRLCLEQIRFTLGIFNRTTRNNPLAWRTLGYICDQAYLLTDTSQEKVMDYHQMINHILYEYKRCQNQKFKWKLDFEDGLNVEVSFVLAVLFIIGDTDGHDKLAGRFTSRTNIAQLCRCCNIPFEETDNPEYKYSYVKHQQIFKKISLQTSSELRTISHHKVNNAWRNIKFCDPQRGLFGALCADILHCIQHGLFLYAHQALFDHKRTKNTTNTDNSNQLHYGIRNVFTKS